MGKEKRCLQQDSMAIMVPIALITTKQQYIYVHKQ